jgi:hypothetical protein
MSAPTKAEYDAALIRLRVHAEWLRFMHEVRAVGAIILAGEPLPQLPSMFRTHPNETIQ